MIISDTLVGSRASGKENDCYVVDVRAVDVEGENKALPHAEKGFCAWKSFFEAVGSIFREEKHAS